jgi:hypothetical protein
MGEKNGFGAAPFRSSAALRVPDVIAAREISYSGTPTRMIHALGFF